MKRIIIILLLIISIIWGYSIIVNGMNISLIGLTVYGYSDIKEQSEDLTLDVASYNKKNNTEFSSALTELEEAIDEYKEAKEEYEEIVEELSLSETSEDAEEIIVASSFPVYEIDFLWATIGGYAKKEGLIITMDVNQNTTVSDSLGYDLYNLSFEVSGEYINIADFLYDLEDDDQLGFEIRDYSMVADTEVEDGEEVIVGTIATFTIYNVPLNSDSLIEEEVTVTEETEEEDTNNTTNTTTNETGTNSVSSNSTNSTNVANSTNNTTN